MDPLVAAPDGGEDGVPGVDGEAEDGVGAARVGLDGVGRLGGCHRLGVGGRRRGVHREWRPERSQSVPPAALGRVERPPGVQRAAGTLDHLEPVGRHVLDVLVHRQHPAPHLPRDPRPVQRDHVDEEARVSRDQDGPRLDRHRRLPPLGSVPCVLV